MWQLDGCAFSVFVLCQEHSVVGEQSKLNFGIVGHVVDMGQVVSGWEARALRGFYENIFSN